MTNLLKAMETTLARNRNMTVNEVRGVSNEALGAAGDERRKGPMYTIFEGVL